MTAKSRKPDIYKSRISYADRTREENSFSDLSVTIMELDTALHLLNSKEEAVLIRVFKHIMDFVRKKKENVEVIKEKNMLDMLLSKQCFMESENIIIRRFALYLTSAMIESMDPLNDLEPEKTKEIKELCLAYYAKETDDFCLEYLSVILNMCLNDPRVAKDIVDQTEYLEKLYELIAKSSNPDIILHSFETLRKLLLVQKTEDVKAFINHPLFPLDRLICDLTNRFKEIRAAALGVIKLLVSDVGDESPFAANERRERVLEQLIQIICSKEMISNLSEAVETLAIAVQTELMTRLFLEMGFFEKIMQYMAKNPQDFTAQVMCRVIMIFAEMAQFTHALNRLDRGAVTDMFLGCLLDEAGDAQGLPGVHILTGLNRMMKLPQAANSIVEAYERGLIKRLLLIMHNPAHPIKIREGAAELLYNLVNYSFHPTAYDFFALDGTSALADILGQDMSDLSIDFILWLLHIIETLAPHTDYRGYLGECSLLTSNLALMLRNSFSHAVLVQYIFRCLCSLVDEENVREVLLRFYISNSVKRALKSLSNVVKTAVTNFILQTCRFDSFIFEYLDSGVLEVLMLYQKHAHCVPTWSPAIECILSKCPTFKFAIRNNLGFTDNTTGKDFFISTKTFQDYRVFQNILREDVSPLYPVFVVNFDRPSTPEEDVVTVPADCFDFINELTKNGWCYCRKPGDEMLPMYLKELHFKLEEAGLVENKEKVQRSIDFDNLAKRAKIIAELVVKYLGEGLKILDLNSADECSQHVVKCHLNDLHNILHCNFIPLGAVRSGCHFERALLFKCLADQIGLPCTLQRSVNGKILFNEVPLPIEEEHDPHCDRETMKYMPWRMLRPTHLVDLMFNVGELYPVLSRQAIQYLRLF